MNCVRCGDCSQWADLLYTRIYCTRSIVRSWTCVSELVSAPLNASSIKCCAHLYLLFFARMTTLHSRTHTACSCRPSPSGWTWNAHATANRNHLAQPYYWSPCAQCTRTFLHTQHSTLYTLLIYHTQAHTKYMCIDICVSIGNDQWFPRPPYVCHITHLRRHRPERYWADRRAALATAAPPAACAPDRRPARRSRRTAEWREPSPPWCGIARFPLRSQEYVMAFYVERGDLCGTRVCDIGCPFSSASAHFHTVSELSTN